MTLGNFIPLLLALVTVIDLVAFRIMLAKGAIRDGMFNLLALGSVSLPFVAYAILAWVMPEWGAIEVF